MPLSQQSLYCAVRIIGDRRDEPDGPVTRGPIGSGFCVSVESEKIHLGPHTYVVTCHHIMVGRGDIEIQIPDPKSGQLSEPLAITDWRWPFEGVDLMIAPLPKTHPNLMTIRLEYDAVPSEDRKIFIGSVAYYIGLLEPDDRAMARSGTFGALDQTGLKFKEGYSYTAHLIDCRSYDGFSGSPCFVEIPYVKVDQEPVPAPLRRPLGSPLGSVNPVTTVAPLAGMFTSYRKDVRGPDGQASVLGVGVVLPVEKIREALMSVELREHRDQADNDGMFIGLTGGGRTLNLLRKDLGLPDGLLQQADIPQDQSSPEAEDL